MSFTVPCKPYYSQLQYLQGNKSITTPLIQPLTQIDSLFFGAQKGQIASTTMRFYVGFKHHAYHLVFRKSFTFKNYTHKTVIFLKMPPVSGGGGGEYSHSNSLKREDPSFFAFSVVLPVHFIQGLNCLNSVGT